VGVTLSWDLFDGGRRRAGRELAAAALEEMRQVDRKVMLAVEADAERAYYALEEARSQLTVAEEGALYAEKVYTIIESGYQNGSETVTRFMDVELALERARMRRVSAAYELRQAEVGVLRSVGRWTDPSQWPDWGYWSWTAPDSEL
jgi:outer membrane protein